MANVHELVVLLTAEDKLSGQLDKTKGKLSGFGGALKGLGIAGGVALAGVGAAAVKMAADFEGKMREVNTMIGLSEEQFAALNDQVLDLSKEVGKSGDELAGALYQAISAGVPASEAIDMLRVSAQAAVGGVTDVETAVDGLTSVMNAFKIPAEEAGRVSDIMFTTVKGGKTTFEELSSSMFQVAPIAAAAGVKFEEVSAAIATVTKQGVPTRVATTQLRAAIQAIIKPTEDMKAAMVSLGISSGQALLEEKGLAGALDILTDAAKGNQEQLGKMFGSVEGLQAVLSLTGDNATTFGKDLEAMASSTGAATDAYNEVNKGAARQFEKLINLIKGMVTELGMKLLPVLTPLIEGITDLVDVLPLEETGELLKDLLPPLVEMILELAKALPIAPIIRLVGSALQPLLAILQAIMAIITPLIKALSWLIDKIATGLGIGLEFLGRALAPMAGAIKGAIPEFQGGGIVPGPLGSPMLARVHGGEMIMPPGRMPMGATYNVQVHVHGSVIAERDLAAVVREELYDIQEENATLEMT